MKTVYDLKEIMRQAWYWFKIRSEESVARGKTFGYWLKKAWQWAKKPEIEDNPFGCIPINF